MILRSPLVLTPKTVSLNPNADVFHHTTSPTMPPEYTSTASPWTEPEQPPAVIEGLPGQCLVDEGELSSSVVQMAIVYPRTPESSVNSEYDAMNGQLGTSHAMFVSTADARSSMDEVGPLEDYLEPEQLRMMLKRQLEYYFSRENLASDTYLVSQMDADQFVPITTVANFNQVKRLTRNIDLIVDILRESANVQVDELGEKVRPLHKRCIVILREIPDSTPIEEVEKLFVSDSCPAFISCQFAHNNSWYVTFDSEEDAQRAYRYLREEVKTFLGMPIMARIKAKPLLRNAYVAKDMNTAEYSTNIYQQPKFAYSSPVPSIQYIPPQNLPYFSPTASVPSVWSTSVVYYDPGMAFAANGYVPTATYTPPPPPPPPPLPPSSFGHDLQSPRSRGLKNRFASRQNFQDHGDVGENEHRRGWQPSRSRVPDDDLHSYEPRRPPRYGSGGPPRPPGHQRPHSEFVRVTNKPPSPRTGMECRNMAPRNPLGVPRSSCSSDNDVFHYGSTGNQSTHPGGRTEYLAQEASVSPSAVTTCDLVLPPRSGGNYKSRRKGRHVLAEINKNSVPEKAGVEANGTVFELEEKFFPPLPVAMKTVEKTENRSSDVIPSVTPTTDQTDQSKISCQAFTADQSKTPCPTLAADQSKAPCPTLAADQCKTPCPTLSTDQSRTPCPVLSADQSKTPCPSLTLAAIVRVSCADTDTPACLTSAIIASSEKESPMATSAAEPCQQCPVRAENCVNGDEKCVRSEFIKTSATVSVASYTSVCPVSPLSTIHLSMDEDCRSSSSSSKLSYAQMALRGKEKKQETRVPKENASSVSPSTSHLKAVSTIGASSSVHRAEVKDVSGCGMMENQLERATKNSCHLLKSHNQRKLEAVPTWN